MLPAVPTLPIHVWACDQTRFGLQTIRRRRLTLRGTKPIGRVQHRFQNFWLYGAVCPQTGDGYFATKRRLHTDDMQAFVDAFAQAHVATLNILLVDNSRCHTTPKLVLPPNVRLLFQPPYTPEVNPIERVWQDLKSQLAWTCASTLYDLQTAIAAIIETYDVLTLRSLIAFPYLMDAIHAVCP